MKEKRVLNHGRIRLVEQMGGDGAVVRAARRCWRSVSKGDASDHRLLVHLLKHNHGTPFEHAVFTFDIKCPLFVARQWFRHRVASYNEVSLRYCVAEKEYYVPDDLEPEGRITYDRTIRQAFEVYDRFLAEGVRKEIARAVLPLALYTEFYWTINVRSLMNFLHLRLAPGAQHEIRVYAQALLEILEETMPVTAKCFQENALNPQVPSREDGP
ncbi:MAG: FAD-dependent thymidylate synthase [Candidatus Eisenbacteria sp.]|nr:FAD-dependent thymidylate synthase [Candidatus Eisenbacteria bacterium]